MWAKGTFDYVIVEVWLIKGSLCFVRGESNLLEKILRSLSQVCQLVEILL